MFSSNQQSHRRAVHAERTRSVPGSLTILLGAVIFTLTVAATAAAGSSTGRDDLAQVRALTAPYKELRVAQEAGWTVQVPRCRDNQPEGGMGWHFANPAFLDATVEANKPEILIYEPQADGTMQLVGVEYVILYKDRPRSATPPTLFGQSFLQNDNDELWMLHVWLHRENPAGMFATWHPKVSCAHAGKH